MSNPDKETNEFAKAAERPRTGIVRELISFLGNNKKWWLAPILILFVIFGVLVLLGGTGAAPFIYTLF